jgi:LPS-assembly lipoprotein
MSSSDNKTVPNRFASGSLPRRGFLLAAASGIGMLAGGCFRPLYGDVAASVPGGGNVKDVLRAIEVEPVPELVGHYLRNELVFELDGSGQDSPKRYKLGVVVKESTEVTVVDSNSGRADSATLILSGTWTLTTMTDNKALFTGESFARVTFDRSSQRFATLRAGRDARIRGAKVLAGLIRNRLAASLVTGV